SYPYSYPYQDPAAGPAPNPNQGPYGTQVLPGDPGAVAPEPGPQSQVQGQAPTQTQYGGLSFQITPSNAGVYVDNVYLGIVSQFSATTQPLTVTPGRHHVE